MNSVYHFWSSFVNPADPAKIIKLASENIVAAQQSVSLYCQAEGNPQPTYTWTPCEQKSVCHKNMLNISEVLSDGVYTCNVTNVLGSDTRNTSIGKFGLRLSTVLKSCEPLCILISDLPKI